MKTAAEIRAQFLHFFQDKQHYIAPSAPVFPQDDPTLMFTNAGMNQFKDVFLGTGTRPYTRCADTQKCIRVAGKHNDLEEVGRDTYHHTFFEMLGNWSFNDYFKREAIRWAWELLVDVWKIPENALWITVFGGDKHDGLPADDEAAELWVRETRIPAQRVLRFGKKDNFWEMGSTGPCGPCSEIHVDLDVALGKSSHSNIEERRALVNAGDPRLVELWNLVFIQFNRQPDGKLVTLPAKHIDTGMGLERLVALLQGKESNYDTDLFTPLLAQIADITGHKYQNGNSLTDIAFRVIADHVRAVTIAFADGALPGNKGRGYVLKRLLRRAVRFGRQGLDMQEPFMYRLVPTVTEIFGDAFPEIGKRRQHIAQLILNEERAFARTLERGIHLFNDLVRELQQQQQTVIPGKKAYQLYHQNGFPRDLIELMAAEQQMTIDDEEWQAAEKQHQAVSSGKNTEYIVSQAELEGIAATRFFGYSKLECNANIVKLIDNDKIILDQTPFYAESGGQIGDTGIICGKAFKFIVNDTQKFGDICVHFGEIEEGNLEEIPNFVTAYVERERRRKIMANHTATHLLHWALREVLGDHVAQQGSLVSPERLRFDVSHPQKISDQEIQRIEKLVNARIYDNIVVRKSIETLERAKKKGAIALFGEKYGEKVRMVTIGRYSKELCGGTHVYYTGDMGYFRIVSESAIQAGVRRIEAVTRDVAVDYVLHKSTLIEEIKNLLKVNDERILVNRIQQMKEEIKQLKKRGMQQAPQYRDEILHKAPTVAGVKIVVHKLRDVPPNELRDLADKLRKATETAVGLIASTFQGKVFLVSFISEKLQDASRLHAGKWMKTAATMIGGGGATKRREFAQGQGPNVAEIDKMLEVTRVSIQKQFADIS